MFQPQLKFIDFVGSISVLPCDVAMVADKISIKWLLTHMAASDCFVSPPVVLGHPYAPGVGQHHVDFAYFFLERF